ncbi:hypothetical protein [Desulfosporosinus sp.]|uniref:hypothetical protein n=1 Tax=Desulfosporosinus sp. TaxID=157907 RepID=UPI00260B7EF2|nr:hypothetical protein [Desulfosporosinus sp.]
MIISCYKVHTEAKLKVLLEKRKHNVAEQLTAFNFPTAGSPAGFIPCYKVLMMQNWRVDN